MNLSLDLEWSKKLRKAGIKGWGKPLEGLLDMVEGDYTLKKDSYKGIVFICPGFMKKGIIQWDYFYNSDPKIAVAEALIWQKGEGK